MSSANSASSASVWAILGGGGNEGYLVSRFPAHCAGTETLRYGGDGHRPVLGHADRYVQ
jgi:hypothetical protein